MKKNLSRKKMIIILLIIIIAFISILFLAYRKSTSSMDEIADNDDPLTDYFNTHIGQIDLGNNENVDIKDKRKYNNSKLIEQEHSYELYKFDNMNISTKEDKCYIYFDVINLKDSNHIDYPVFFSFYDEDDKLISSIDFQFEDTNIGEEKHYEIETYFDVSNAYDYKVEGFLNNKE